jgi:hypothetical protein
MKTFLDRFILGIPRLYIKQFPYAWIVFVAFWTWPPNLSWIFLLVVLVGLLLVEWHHAAWISTLRMEHAGENGKFYIDRPPVPWRRAIQNILILLTGAGIVAFFLNKQIELTALQVFLIIVGFALLYRNSTFFGSRTTYIVTDEGLAVYFAPGHLDYRVFIKFNEISRIERCGYQKDQDWDCFARTRASDGLLLLPGNPSGFTKRMEKLFISPGDLDTFMKQMPTRLQL